MAKGSDHDRNDEKRKLWGQATGKEEVTINQKTYRNKKIGYCEGVVNRNMRCGGKENDEAPRKGE